MSISTFPFREHLSSPLVFMWGPCHSFFSVVCGFFVLKCILFTLIIRNKIINIRKNRRDNHEWTIKSNLQVWANRSMSISTFPFREHLSSPLVFMWGPCHSSFRLSVFFLCYLFLYFISFLSLSVPCAQTCKLASVSPVIYVDIDKLLLSRSDNIYVGDRGQKQIF
jgi:hypothetical protein